MDGQNPRTNGESKAIQTKSHTEAYTYTLTKRGKGEKIIYLAPKVHLLDLGWFVVYSGIPQMQVHQIVCGALIHCSWGCWVKFPFLFFVSMAPGFQLWIWTRLCVYVTWGRLFPLRQDGVKGAADSGALAPSGRGGGRGTDAGRGCGGRGRRDVAPAWGMPCVLPGKLSLDHGTLSVASCTGSQEGRCG